MVDEIGNPDTFQERHYSEFITFLPHVQRFLYGEDDAGDSPIRVYRRGDIAAARVVLSAAHPRPIEFSVAHVDLYFFLEIDAVILALEVHADDLPHSEQHLADFEWRYCYDRGWRNSSGGGPLRLMTCGRATVVIGAIRDRPFTGLTRGALAQFRHQHCLVLLIAHLQKAALPMLSDRLAGALNRLDIASFESVRQFERKIRATKETFLRFMHRYWFHEVSDQVQARDLYHVCAGHLGVEPPYAEVREGIQDMSDYLDSDSPRRQANTVVPLTAVTTFWPIGTVVTGFLGMNPFALADWSAAAKLVYFALTLVPVTVLTCYTNVKSERLSDFLESLSDERLPARAKLASLAAVWKRGAR